jgi:hypothetical protein
MYEMQSVDPSQSGASNWAKKRGTKHRSLVHTSASIATPKSNFVQLNRDDADPRGPLFVIPKAGNPDHE